MGEGDREGRTELADMSRFPVDDGGFTGWSPELGRGWDLGVVSLRGPSLNATNTGASLVVELLAVHLQPAPHSLPQLRTPRERPAGSAALEPCRGAFPRPGGAVGPDGTRCSQ